MEGNGMAGGGSTEQMTGNGNGTGMGNGRRTLVVYYSRSGTTHKVAEELARELGADLERITDHEDRKGFIGYMKSGREASTDILVDIDEPKWDPAGYDLVVIGTPVWAWKMCSPVRSYLAKYAGRIKEAAYFCTADGKEGKTLEGMATFAGKPAKASMVIYRKSVLRNEHIGKVREFVSKLNGNGSDKKAEEGALA